MQVFGLPSRCIRTARAALRLLDAKSPTIEAASRRDAVACWGGAIAQGLTVDHAAQAVGIPRSNLYLWEKGRLRQKAAGPVATAPKARRYARQSRILRADVPCGASKIAVLPRREGRSSRPRPSDASCARSWIAASLRPPSDPRLYAHGDEAGLTRCWVDDGLEYVGAPVCGFVVGF